MPPFAEVSASPDANALKSWLEVLFYLVGGVTAVVILWQKLSGRSGKREIQQPLEVKAHCEYATTAQLAKVEKELKEDLTKGAASRKKMHEEIEAMRVAQARIEVKNDEQSRQLTNLDQKMDMVLMRLPRG